MRCGKKKISFFEIYWDVVEFSSPPQPLLKRDLFEMKSVDPYHLVVSLQRFARDKKPCKVFQMLIDL